MPRLKVAHLREQGQDMILVPVNDNFAHRSERDQAETLDQIQRVATSAGLRGSVAALWNGGFIGPRPWHPFLKSVNLRWVMSQVNRELSW